MAVDAEGNVISDVKGGYFDSQGNPVNALGFPLQVNEIGNHVHLDEKIRGPGLCVEC